MKMLQENKGFSPVAIVLQSHEEVEIFWNMLLRVSRCADVENEVTMAIKISDWLSTEAHL